VRQALLLACVLAAVSCTAAPESQAPPSSASNTPAANASQAGAPQFPLKVAGTQFVDSAARPFPWRGITAFRLVEMVASGREAEAVQYLEWAAKEDLNVVRVLTMARHLFELRPENGRNALPRLLDLARERGIGVEVVALADTTAYPLDYDTHVRHVGRIALEKGNAFVEIANEPGHPTQVERLHDPAELKRLATLIPSPVVMALGSAEYAAGYADGDYATYHFPRAAGWDHVLRLAEGASFIAHWKKPVINDEPVGAAPEYVEGRRENDPARFAAAAALTALAGMGGTFHYEGGLQARIPAGREAACLAAWQLGGALVTGMEPSGGFLDGQSIDAIARISGARAVYARADDRSATVLLIDPQQPKVDWTPGWTEERRSGVPGVIVLRAVRR
jgi:hypothetical protein